MYGYGRGPSLLTIVYLGIGLFVAADYKYLKGISNAEDVISAFLAVILWPLLLFDVSLRIN